MKHNKTKSFFSILTAMVFLAPTPNNAIAGADPFIGEINYVAFNYAPPGWAACNGQILPIAQYSAVFALLGTTFGGNGTTNFALPDLRGRVPIHQGQGPGLSNYGIGQTGGVETITLNVNQMPNHTHAATATSVSTSTVAPGATATSTLKAVNSDATEKNAGGNTLANAAGLGKAYSTSAPNVSMNAGSIETTLNNVSIATTTSTNVVVAGAGGSQPFSIMQPYLAVNCIIALEGIFPPRP